MNNGWNTSVWRIFSIFSDKCKHQTSIVIALKIHVRNSHRKFKVFDVPLDRIYFWSINFSFKTFELFIPKEFPCAHALLNFPPTILRDWTKTDTSWKWCHPKFVSSMQGIELSWLQVKHHFESALQKFIILIQSKHFKLYQK